MHERTGGSVCSRHTIREEALLAIVREDISRQLEFLDVDESRVALEIQQSFNRESLDNVKKRRDQLAVRLSELAVVGKKLYEDRLKGTITVDTFKSLSESAENDKLVARSEFEQLSELIATEESYTRNVESILPKLKEFLSLERMTTDTLSALIERIVVSESNGRSPYRTHEVKIYYRFEAVTACN